MTNLEISLILVILLFICGIALYFSYIYYNKKKKAPDSDMFIIIGEEDKPTPSGNTIFKKVTKVVKVPDNQNFKANVYPEDRILYKGNEVVIIGRDRNKVVKLSKSTGTEFTIKRGTQSKLTKL